MEKFKSCHEKNQISTKDFILDRFLTVIELKVTKP
jgi:hypothetical protein